MFKPLADANIVEAVNKINQTVHETNIEFLQIWQKTMLFKWHWWVEFGLAILPWLFWMKVRKKESTYRLLFGGLAVLILASFFDVLGFALGLWGYNYVLVPLIPPFFPWDFTLMPVTAMLFYQFKPKIKPYIKAICFSALSSFIIQPLFQLLGFYNPMDWKHYYSFPIIFIIYLIGYYFATREKFEKI